jgi:hypothetical protein
MSSRQPCVEIMTLHRADRETTGLSERFLIYKSFRIITTVISRLSNLLGQNCAVISLSVGVAKKF